MPKIELLKYQEKFLNSTAREAMLLGGIGTGKSFCGALFVLQMIAQYPKTPGIVVAPTYLQLVKATVKSITQVLDDHGITHKAILSGADKRIEMPGRSHIHLFSLQDPDNFRGPEAGWLLGDEMCFASEYAYKVVIGRIRHARGPLLKRFTSSPNGYNWAYDKWENKDGKKANTRVELVRAKTKENIFLPPSYYEDLLEEYGGIKNPMARQELNGEFVNLTAGAVYWAFDRSAHVIKAKPDASLPVFVGQDFNIDNMAGCYIQKQGDKFIVFQESILDQYDANTDTASQEIVKNLKDFRHISVIPDSTGKSRKTSASGRSDHEIMRSYGLDVMVTRNPFIRDRQNNVNVNFKKGNLLIDESCTTLIKELETLSNRDKEGEKAHVSVGLGYVLNRLEPLRRTTKSTSYIME